MQVLITIGLIAGAAVWIIAVLQRLTRLRDEVKAVWKRLEADQSNEAIKTVYNKHVAKYNNALDAFPANLLGPVMGFKSAKSFP